MLSQRTANLVFVAAVIIACIYFAWVAEGFVTSGLLASSGLPSKFFPQLLLGLTAVCALLVGYQYFWHGAAGGDDGDSVFDSPTEARQGLLMLVVSVICYIVWRSIGFVPMAVLMGPLSLLAMGIRKPKFYVAVLGLTAVVWSVFTFGLGIQLV